MESRRMQRTLCHDAKALSWIWTLDEPCGAQRCHNCLSEVKNKQRKSRWFFFCFWGGVRYREQRQNKTIWSGRCATFHSFSTSSWSLLLLSISSTYGSWNMTNDGTLCNTYKEQIKSEISHETWDGIAGSLPPSHCLGALPVSKSRIYRI